MENIKYLGDGLRKIPTPYGMGGSSYKMKKNAQVWSLDVIVGVTIFTIAMVLFYVYTINLSGDTESKSQDLSTDAEFFSSNLLSEGSPLNWNETNVLVPGILTGVEINQTKLDNLFNITNSSYPDGYQRMLSLMGTRFDFYFYLNDPVQVASVYIDGIGKQGVNRTNLQEVENPANVIRIERFTVYQDKPTKLTLLLWDK